LFRAFSGKEKISPAKAEVIGAFFSRVRVEEGISRSATAMRGFSDETIAAVLIIVPASGSRSGTHLIWTGEVLTAKLDQNMLRSIGKVDRQFARDTQHPRRHPDIRQPSKGVLICSLLKMPRNPSPYTF